MKRLLNVLCCATAATVDENASSSTVDSPGNTVSPPTSAPPLPPPPSKGTSHYLKTLGVQHGEQQSTAQSSSSAARRVPKRQQTLPNDMLAKPRVQNAVATQEEPSGAVAPRTVSVVRSRSLMRDPNIEIGQSKKDKIKAAQDSDFYHGLVTADIDGLVRMKPQTKDNPGGVATYILLRAAMVLVDPVLKEQGFDPRPKKHSTLTRQADGTWEAKGAENEETWHPEKGKKYIFVTMKDGTIRIGSSEQGKNGHAMLSGYSPYVLFAGELMFKRDQPEDSGEPSEPSESYKPISICPRSGTYQPLFSQWEKAGFGDECEPVHIDSWNDIR